MAMRPSLVAFAITPLPVALRHFCLRLAICPLPSDLARVSLLSPKVPYWQALGLASGARGLPKDGDEMCYDLLNCPSCPLLSS